MRRVQITEKRVTVDQTTEKTTEGFFHEFSRSSFGNNVAIVELDDGSVEAVSVARIKFLDKPGGKQ